MYIENVLVFVEVAKNVFLFYTKKIIKLKLLARFRK